MDRVNQSENAGRPLRTPQDLISNTLWQIGPPWLQFLVSVFINIWMARHLGPELYGQLAYALAFIAIFKLVTLIGAELHLRVEFTRSKNSAETLVAALWLRTCGALIFYGFLVLYVIVGNLDRSQTILFLVTGSLLFSSISDVFQSFYLSRLQARNVALSNFAGFILSMGIRVAAILMDLPLWVFGLASALEVVGAGYLLGLRFYLEKPMRLKLASSWPTVKNVFWHSFPLYVSSIAIAVYLRTDQLMIQWIVGEQALGWYAAAARMVERLHLIPVAVGATFLPVIMNQKMNHDPAVYKSNMQRFFDLNVFISMGLLMGFFFGGRSLVHWALGEKYGPTVPILGVLILALPFLFLGVSRGQYVITERWYKFAMWTNVSGVLLNLILNGVLILRFGALGAAWATLISYILVYVGASFLFRSTREMGILQLRALLLPCRPASALALSKDLISMAGNRRKKRNWE